MPNQLTNQTKQQTSMQLSTLHSTIIFLFLTFFTRLSAVWVSALLLFVLRDLGHERPLPTYVHSNSCAFR